MPSLYEGSTRKSAAWRNRGTSSGATRPGNTTAPSRPTAIREHHQPVPRGPVAHADELKLLIFVKEQLGGGRKFLHSFDLDKPADIDADNVFARPSELLPDPSLILRRHELPCVSTQVHAQRLPPALARLGQASANGLTDSERQIDSFERRAEPPPQGGHPVRVHQHVAAHGQSGHRKTKRATDHHRCFRIREHGDAQDQIERDSH